eukprot:Sspe_Gene.111712::Locus_93849_Transcript_1_1_Confidence_1.000_Length_1978::g.111712::m.111712
MGYTVHLAPLGLSCETMERRGMKRAPEGDEPPCQRRKVEGKRQGASPTIHTTARGDALVTQHDIHDIAAGLDANVKLVLLDFLMTFCVKILSQPYDTSLRHKPIPPFATTVRPVVRAAEELGLDVMGQAPEQQVSANLAVSLGRLMSIARSARHVAYRMILRSAFLPEAFHAVSNEWLRLLTRYAENAERDAARKVLPTGNHHVTSLLKQGGAAALAVLEAGGLVRDGENVVFSQPISPLLLGALGRLCLSARRYQCPLQILVCSAPPSEPWPDDAVLCFHEIRLDAIAAYGRNYYYAAEGPLHTVGSAVLLPKTGPWVVREILNERLNRGPVVGVEVDLLPIVVGPPVPEVLPLLPPYALLVTPAPLEDHPLHVLDHQVFASPPLTAEMAVTVRRQPGVVSVVVRPKD